MGPGNGETKTVKLMRGFGSGDSVMGRAPQYGQMEVLMWVNGKQTSSMARGHL
jgi:hypothetical protein